MKVLHILYQSLPDTMGSSIRTRDLLRSLRDEQVCNVAITSPFQRPETSGAAVEAVDGVKVHRTYVGDSAMEISQTYRGLRHRLRRMRYLVGFIRSVRRVVIEERPDVIHAHAMFFCFFAGYGATRRRKIPLIYEVRSLWEDMEAQGGSIDLFRLQARVIGMLERAAIRLADRVITINETLRQEVLRRTGIDSLVVPNAIDHRSVQPVKPLNHGVGGSLRYGYIGGLNQYEGLHLAIEAFIQLWREGELVPFTVFGDGAAMARIAPLAAQCPEAIQLRGGFHPDQAAQVYDELDVVVLPRESTYLTERVTPLKPLEAVAFGKKVLLSDIGGHREVMSGVPGVTFFRSNDVQSIKDVVRDVNRMPRERLQGELDAARAFVCATKSWSANATRIAACYRSLVSERMHP